jgi:Ca2+-binding EF-hand superfamily protein
MHGTAVGALLPGLAAAQSSGEKRQALAKQIQERFLAADKNGDGQLSREEAKSGMPRVSERFEEIDAGGKGFVTLNDLKAHFAQRLGKRSGAGS